MDVWPEFAEFENEDPFNDFGNKFTSEDPFNEFKQNDFVKNGNGFHPAADETKRQETIQELITTEENYMADMKIFKKVCLRKIFVFIPKLVDVFSIAHYWELFFTSAF